MGQRDPADVLFGLLVADRIQFGVRHPVGNVEGPGEFGASYGAHELLTVAEAADRYGCSCGKTGHRLAYRVLPDWRVKSQDQPT